MTAQEHAVLADQERIHEVIAEGDGFWMACSGCQESVDGYVSEKDYPYSKTFKCQPGGGCSECGGLGVLWDQTDYDEMASWMLDDMKAQEVDERLRAGSAALLASVQELLPAVRAYLMSGDVMTQGLKKRTWGPAVERASAAITKATAASSVGTPEGVNQEAPGKPSSASEGVGE